MLNQDLPIALEKVSRQLKKNFGIWFGPIFGVFIVEPDDIELIAEKTKSNSKREDNENKLQFNFSLFNQLFSSDEATQEWTKDDIKKHLLTLYVTAHDTLHGLISFSLLMIAMHQEVQDKIRQEVKEVVEVFRLFPITPLLGRVTNDDLKLTSYTLPKGCSIALLAFGVQRNPNYWIEPDKFNPERFTPENSKNIPFSRGVRMCPGYKYGLACLKIIICHVIRNYELSTSMKMSDLDLYMNVSIHNRTGYPLIAEKTKNYPKSKDNENDSKFRCSLFDQLFSNVEATQKWTKEETKTNLFTLFLASHDTLHGTISFSLLMIAMHQEVQDKIRQEVNEIVGDELINENVLNNLTYIDMTLKEIIRLFPIAPLMGRVTSDDLKLTSHTVPKGCSIALFALGVHKNPKYWIEPDKFNPERFSVENSKNRPKYAYIPFSGGARMCPGYKYGLACLKTIISHVIRNYELSTNMKMSDLDLYMNVSIHNRTGYPVSLKKLKS
ncbi:cytochrome P450 4d1-like [Aphidius gifuensis]|uniref:cytochrome P450 4d1-like n=1 Tax=Aphidius gifuensis TaxID=684658 RepID=UPI001CDB81CA|nr:cytochrome P450 4d1-like [Aphidius gifuensis]